MSMWLDEEKWSIKYIRPITLGGKIRSSNTEDLARLLLDIKKKGVCNYCSYADNCNCEDDNRCIDGIKRALKTVYAYDTEFKNPLVVEHIYNKLSEEDKDNLYFYRQLRPSTYNVIYVKDKPYAGFISLSEGDDDYDYVAIAVLPSYRGTGVANYLLNSVLNNHDRPIRYIVKKDNLRGLGFIKKRHDFSLVEDSPIYRVYQNM